MAVAALVPLIASGVSATAGVAAATGATTVLGTSLATVASTASLVSGAFQGISSFMQAQDAADAQEMASQQRARELRLQAQQESTQSAINEAERQRRLRRTIASQRAAGAGFVEESGNLLNIQQQTASQAQREGRFAELQSSLSINQLNRQALSEVRAGQNQAIATRSKAFTNLAGSLIDVSDQAFDIKDTLK